MMTTLLRARGWSLVRFAKLTFPRRTFAGSVRAMGDSNVNTMDFGTARSDAPFLGLLLMSPL